MKKFLLFASAFAILFTTSCDELPDDLKDDLEDLGGNGDGNGDNNNGGSDNNGDDQTSATGLVKSLNGRDDDGMGSDINFSYDDQNRISKLSFTSIVVCIPDTPVEVKSAGASADSDASTETHTYTSNFDYTYGDNSLIINCNIETPDGDGDEETSIEATTNNDGYITAYSESYTESYTQNEYNEETGETTEVTISTLYETEYTYTYTDGYLTSSTENEYVTRQDSDRTVMTENRRVYTWENGNLVKVMEYADPNDINGDGVDEDEKLYIETTFSYGDVKNTLNIDLAMSFANSSDFIIGFEPNFFGKGTADLPTEYIYIRHDVVDGSVTEYNINKYEYTVEGDTVTEMKNSWGEGENKDEAEADLEYGSTFEFAYYE